MLVCVCVCIWMTWLSQLSCEASLTISDVNVLLPFSEERAPYQISVTGGCFRWKSHNSELIVVKPLNENKKKCSNAALVSIAPSFTYAGRSRNTWIEVCCIFNVFDEMAYFESVRQLK